MVELLTLLIGLTVGVQEVEVSAPDAAARVELRLDGQVQARMEAPPWRAPVDFGEVLIPHELEAVAFADDGSELGRDGQWVNLPRSSAEARLGLLHGEGGPPAGQGSSASPTAVRLTWENDSGEAPSTLELSFDGEPLEVVDPRRVPLPAHDPDEVHFVTAELVFADGSVARAEATFGGVYGAEIFSDLTAVPVRLRPSQRDPALADTRGWLRHGERLLDVVAIERGPADVVLVRERGAEDLLRRLRAEAVRAERQRSRVLGRGRGVDSLRFDMGLERHDRLIFLWPVVEEKPHPRFDEVGLFYGQEQSFAEGGLYWFLTRLYPEDRSLVRGRQRLADAVAVAGRRAATADRRRAVVLVLGRDPDDESRQAIESVRTYLRSLGVPLHLWSTRPVRDGDPASAWGTTRPIHGLDRLRKAVARLEEELESQRILWVRGRYLPHRIEPGPAAPRGLVLAVDDRQLDRQLDRQPGPSEAAAARRSSSDRSAPSPRIRP